MSLPDYQIGAMNIRPWGFSINEIVKINNITH
jgi:hypothetical protein